MPTDPNLSPEFNYGAVGDSVLQALAGGTLGLPQVF